MPRSMVFGSLILLVLGVASAAPVPAETPWVTVRGRVVWPEKVAVPPNRPINLVGAPDAMYALRGGPIFEDKVLVAPKGRGLKNVVVSLRLDNQDRKAAFPVERIHPDFKGAKPTNHVVKSEFCRYDRRILPVREGDAIEFRNNQPVVDNIQFSSGEFQSNRVQLAGSSWTTDPVTGFLGSFNSSIHHWMKGYIRVFDHPYFAITDADGFFEIPKAPTGKWRIQYWHELGYHKGAAGRFGFPIEIKDEGRGTKGVATLEYENPTLP